MQVIDLFGDVIDFMYTAKPQTLPVHCTVVSYYRNRNGAVDNYHSMVCTCKRTGRGPERLPCPLGLVGEESVL